MAAPPPLEVSDAVLADFKPTRVFKPATVEQDSMMRITSLSFHRTDPLLFTGSEDDVIRVVDVDQGVEKAALPAPQYGVGHVTATHAPTAIVHASTKEAGDGSQDALLAAHALRYLDLHTNSYIRFLTGHAAPVTNLSFSPARDVVASADAAGAVLWFDVRSPGPVARLAPPPNAHRGATVAFDEQGLVVAVAVDGRAVSLFSVAELGKGPFTSLPLGPAAGFGAAPPDRMAFNAPGHVLAASGGGALAIVDAFGDAPPLLRALPGPPPPGSPPMTPAFTPDGCVVLSGCHDCAIRSWRVPPPRTAHPPPPAPGARAVAEWHGHSDAPAALAWAPGRALVAAGCYALALWQPAR